MVELDKKLGCFWLTLLCPMSKERHQLAKVCCSVLLDSSIRRSRES